MKKYLYAVALLSVGCSAIDKHPVASPVTISSSAPVAAYVGSAGVKNVRQVLRSMTAVTNIPVSTLATGGANAGINAQYQVIAPFLSADGSVTSINPAMLLSITGLAGQVCQVFVAGEAASPNVLKTTQVVFSGSGSWVWSNQFSATSTVPAAVVTAMANQFWGRPPTADELSALITAISSSVTTVPDTGSAGVADVLIVPCTIMLASPEFLLG